MAHHHSSHLNSDEADCLFFSVTLAKRPFSSRIVIRRSFSGICVERKKPQAPGILIPHLSLYSASAARSVV
jgi:hypothetical protein